MFLRKADIDVDDAVLRALSRRNPQQAAARVPAIADLVAAIFGESADVTCLRSQGTFHLVHRARLRSGRNLVIRSSLPEIFGRDDGLLIEQVIAPHLVEAGVPAPVIHWVSVGQSDLAPFDFAVLEEASGRGLQFFDEREQEDAEIWRALGATLCRVHAIRGDGAGPLLPLSCELGGRLKAARSSWRSFVLGCAEEHVARCRDAGLLAPAESDEALRRITDLEWSGGDQSVLLHGDPGNHNIFVDDERSIVLIDWEDALLGDPVFDVAMWATFHPARRHAPFFAGYGAPAADDRFRVAFAIYFLRIILAKAVVRRRFGYPDVPGRPTMRDRISSSLVAVRRALSGSGLALFE